GNSSKISDPRLLGDLLEEDIEFIECFDMFGNKTDGNNQNIVDPLFTQPRDHITGKRLQPFHRTNLALKRELIWISAFETIHDQLNGFLRLFEIRITFTNIPFRNAVSTE